MLHPDARISATTKVQIQSHPGERWTVSCCALNKRDGRSLTVTLMELLEGLEDPRRPQGKRHPLPALLGLAVVAMLAGMTSYEAIVQYGKERGWEFLKLLGFTSRRGLCKATYSRLPPD